MSNEKAPQDPQARPELGQNPFNNPDLDNETRPSTPSHVSDDPGRAYPGGEPDRADARHPSSGASGPSEPRRPGLNVRQAPRRSSADSLGLADPVVPGELLLRDEPVVINAGREVTSLRVSNPSDRPVQVGSHFHFAEVNPALQFDRQAAWGKRLNVLSGGSVRFEPGVDEEVELVPFAGALLALGFRGECAGPLDG